MIIYLDTSAVLKLVVEEPESPAAALPGKLRSADAIHLAAAIRLQYDVMVAYDAELVAAAVEAGINVLSPGG